MEETFTLTVVMWATVTSNVVDQLQHED